MSTTHDTSLNYAYSSMAALSRRKPLMWGAVMCAFGCAWLAGAVIAWREDAIVGVILLGGLAYLGLVFGINRLRAALDTGWHISAGPTGIRYRTPAIGVSMLFGGLGVQERHLSWNEIKAWRAEPVRGPVRFTLSDWVSDSIAASLTFELVDGEVLFVSMAPFAESQYDIEDRIRQLA